MFGLNGDLNHLAHTECWCMKLEKRLEHLMMVMPKCSVSSCKDQETTERADLGSMKV